MDHNRQDWLKTANVYPKFETEFYDVIKDCAEYIDGVIDIDLKLKLNKRLNKIFIIRHRGLAMAMFKQFYINPNQKGAFNG